MANQGKGRYCGNCEAHNSYEYPSKIFCYTRYELRLDPIVDTLWCCEHWSEVSQECYCVREALKEKNAKEAAQS